MEDENSSRSITCCTVRDDRTACCGGISGNIVDDETTKKNIAILIITIFNNKSVSSIDCDSFFTIRNSLATIIIMSSNHRNAKRSSTTTDAAANKRPHLSYEWMSDGTEAGNELFDPDTYEFEGVRLHLNHLNQNQVMVIQPGSIVQLASGNNDNEVWICRVEHVFQTADAEPQFRGRWFYGTADLKKLLTECNDAKEERALQDLRDELGEAELVLSNVEEDNPLASIIDTRTVKYNDEVRAEDQFLCRHCLDWDSEIKCFSIRAVNDSDRSSNEKESSQDDDDDDDESSQNGNHSDEFSHVIQEGEGSIRPGHIQVGDNYQVAVGPFVPNRKVVSRNPTVWWKPGCVAEENLQAFSDRVAAAQTPFLLEHNMTNDEPYTPLSTSRVGEFLQHFPEGEILTTSHMSSASVTMGEKYSKLFKECDIDEVLCVLAEHDFDTQEALGVIEKDRERISNAWTATEREIFDSSYRRNHGNLRVVAQDLMTKTMKQVVDYFYSFKIPDQFRKYQNKKREQAVHLMECIDRRRRGLPILLPKSNSNESDGESGDENTKAKPSHWQENNVDESLHSVERRYGAAKKLLLEVDSLLGEDVFVKVATAVRKLRTSHDRSLKESILRELKGHPDLQRRFLDFLPREV